MDLRAVPLSLLFLLAVGCGSTDPAVPAVPAPRKLSRYDKVQALDLATGGGALCLLFNERKEYGAPLVPYFLASTDDGASWSEPEPLGPLDAPRDASQPRLALDAAGRLYAIWKEITIGTLLDGPGGKAPGILAFRCRESGAWGPRVELGTPAAPAYSWFVAPGPDGAVHLVYSRMTAPVRAVLNYDADLHAGQVEQVVLAGSARPEPRVLRASRAPLTQADLDAQRAAGKPVDYSASFPDKDGLLDLAGRIGADGRPRFLAEDPGIADGPNPTGRRVVYFDGQAFSPLAEYPRYETFNNFEAPPALLADAAGKLHVIRSLEHPGEVRALLDARLEGSALGPARPVLAPKSATGLITAWRAHALPGGKMAVTAALTETGGTRPQDLELVLVTSDGGAWSAPVVLTRNAERAAFFAKETTARDRVAAASRYVPRSAALAAGPDGSLRVAMVLDESTLLGFESLETSGGRAVNVISGAAVDAPGAWFLKP